MARQRRVAFGVAGACMVLVVNSTPAAPVATGPQARAFLGGASGKLVYTKLDCNDNSCNKQGRSLWYVDFSESTLTERQVVDYHSENTEPRNTIISPDGDWIVYNTRQRDNPLYINRLVQNSTTRIDMGDGAVPVWWTKPGTAELYVIYVDNDLEDGGWMGGYNGGFPNSSTGATRCRQVNPVTMASIGSAQRIMSYQANGGRSVSGAWMFTAGGCPGTFRIDPTGTSDVTIYEEISLSVDAWSDSDSLDGCNPSMSPHANDNDLRVMYVLRNGNENHRGYWVCDVRGDNRQKFIWDNTENPYFDEPQWSNHADYAAAKASRELTTAPFDIYIYRVWNGSHLKILEGNYSFPYLWIDPATIGTAAPAPARPASRDWRLALAGGVLRSTGAAGRLLVVDSRGRAVVSTVVSGTEDCVVLRAMAPGAYTAVVRTAEERVMSRRLVVGNGLR